MIPKQQRVVPLLVAMVNLSRSELQMCVCVYLHLYMCVCVCEQVRE